jgi:DNA-directed RNA polymerase subunit RPC12/RpoP
MDIKKETKMVQTYKCPGCGASIAFQPGAHELVCEYCGTHVDIAELNEETQDNAYQVENEVDHTAEEHVEVNSYICQSCGAHLLVDENTTATNCCYCGSPALIQERLNGALKPVGVIPFQIDKQQAKERFQNWLGTGLFTPSVFKKAATLENIKGIYVPFWLYDYEAEADAEAECTKVIREHHGDTETIHTDYYHVVRDVRSNYFKIPADASEKMPDDVMDKMEPYNYQQTVDFSMPYLSGYESEKYNYESSDPYMVKRIEDRVNTYILQDTQSTIQGYSSTKYLRKAVTLRRKKAVYTLLPVWMITYRYQNENKIFAINGQTGKQVGKLPNSKQKIAGTFAGITIGIALVLSLLGGLLG